MPLATSLRVERGCAPAQVQRRIAPLTILLREGVQLPSSDPQCGAGCVHLTPTRTDPPLCRIGMALHFCAS
jgi:hypothetical protein